MEHCSSIVKNTNNLQRKTVSFNHSCLEEIYQYENVISETERRALSYSHEEIKSFHLETKKMGIQLKKQRKHRKRLNRRNRKEMCPEAEMDKNEEDATLAANSGNISGGGCLIIYCNNTLGMEQFLKNRSSFHPRKYVQGLLDLQEQQRRGIYNDPNNITKFLEACSRDSRKYALKIAAE